MPELFHTYPILAAGIDLGDTVWIIFLVIWGIIQMFSKKAPEAEEIADPEAAERARRIQEEIRRRIMERRQENQNQPTHQEGPFPFSDSGSKSSQVKPQQIPTHAPQIQRPTSKTREGPDPDYRQWQPKASTPSYTQQIEDQRKRIEEKRKESEALLKKAFENQHIQDTSEKTQWGHRAKSKKRPIRTQNLINTLKDPHALREAILVREIIGPPKSLK